MFGVFFNLSFWYKLTDRTIWGAYFSGIGAIVLIAIDILFIPRFSYMACAWAGFAAYATSMVLSYFIGQRYYPINYPLKDIAFYVILTVVLTASMYYITEQYSLGTVGSLIYNTLCIIFFVSYILHNDLPLSSLPVIANFQKMATNWLQLSWKICIFAPSKSQYYVAILFEN